MKLVDNARAWYKMWSIRLAAVGAFLTTILTLLPDWALIIWAQMPDKIRDSIPPDYLPLLGVGFMIASMVARVIKQQKLPQDTRPTNEATKD